MNLKHSGLHATYDFVLVGTDGELDFNPGVLTVDAIDQLWLIDVTIRLTEQAKGQGIQHSGFASPVSAYDKCRRYRVQFDLCK
jgi:hypothetical protein